MPADGSEPLLLTRMGARARIDVAVEHRSETCTACLTGKAASTSFTPSQEIIMRTTRLEVLAASTLRTLMAVFVVSGGVARAQTFSIPTALATGDLAGYRVSSAIDTHSDGIALWSGEYSDRIGAAGAWSPKQGFGGTGSPTQTVRMTAAGAATAVWVDSFRNIMTADLPLGGAWSSPALLATPPGSPAPSFVMDSHGDAGVVVATSSGEILAYRRAAGALSWGSEEVVTVAPTGSHLVLSGAAMGEAGDFAVTWQTYQVRCSRFCVDVNYIVHVSREQLAGTTWDDSGPLTAGVNRPGYAALPAVDIGGRAAVIYLAPYGPIVSSQTQATYGGLWSNPATVFATTSGGLLGGVNIANNGRLTVAVLNFASTGTNVVAIDGNVATNTWSHPTTLSNLSGGDSSGVVALVSFGGSTNGAAVAEWGDGDGTIRAATRRPISPAWGATQTINGPVVCGSLGPTCSGPLAASINNAGHAFVIFATSDPQLTTFAIWVASE